MQQRSDQEVTEALDRVYGPGADEARLDPVLEQLQVLSLQPQANASSRVRARFGDALRGYAFPIHQRDHFRCRYCGLDGTVSFANWLALSWDHLLPKGRLNRNNADFIVTACMFCNTADNRYFDLAVKRGLRFDGLTPEELVAQRLPYVLATRESYQEFWKEHVRPKT